MSLENEIQDYYSDLLILQYAGKPKFSAFIKAIAKQVTPINSATGNLLLSDIQNGFNIDDAVGAQLDLLGKYIGLARTYVDVDIIAGNYFDLIEYDQSEIPDTSRGFTDYLDFETKEGETLDYDKVTSGAARLSDFEYRTLLKLKIVRNNKDATMKTIDDALFMFFQDDLFFEEVGTMKLVYWYQASLRDIVSFAFDRDVIPRPAGVKITGAIINAEGGYFGMPSYNDTILEPFTGFTTYADFDTKEGEMLNYEKLTI